MKINRNNYEAFLLDYIEGNLSAELLAELMLFLQQNPGIDHGLEDFNLITVNNDEIRFNQKDLLKRKEFVINDDLIEGLIIAYVNDDLSSAEKKKLLETISHNKEYQLLFDQYLRTHLEKSNESFSDKVLLKGHLPVTGENMEYFVIADVEGVLSGEEKKALHHFRKNNPETELLFNQYASLCLNADTNIFFDKKSSLKKREGVVISFSSVVRYTTIAAAACFLLYFGFFSGKNETQQTAVNNTKTEKQTADENKLIANENVVIPEKENRVEDKKEITPVNYSNNNSLTDKSHSSDSFQKNRNEKSVAKDPVIEYADDLQVGKDPSDNSPVLLAKENLPILENEDSYALAVNNNSSNEDDFITPGQYVRNWAKKTFFTEKAIEEHADPVTELADNSVLQLKGTNTTFTNKKEKDYREYGFSIGKFSFHRKIKK